MDNKIYKTYLSNILQVDFLKQKRKITWKGET